MLRRRWVEGVNYRDNLSPTLFPPTHSSEGIRNGLPILAYLSDYKAQWMAGRMRANQENGQLRSNLSRNQGILHDVKGRL